MENNHPRSTRCEWFGNRHAMRANVNKVRDANVCRALCHLQITHSKQNGNRKQTFWKKQGTLTEKKLLNNLSFAFGK